MEAPAAGKAALPRRAELLLPLQAWRMALVWAAVGCCAGTGSVAAPIAAASHAMRTARTGA